MTAPTFFGRGTENSGTGAVTYQYPFPFDGGEFLLALVEDANEGATPTPTPSGWGLLTGTPVGTGAAAGAASTAIRAYYKFAAPGDTLSFTLGDLGDHQVGALFSVLGVDATNPFDVAAVTGTAAASTAVVFPSITTVTNDALVLCFVADAFDSATAQGSAFAHAGLTGVGSGSFGSASGNGGGISYLYGVRAAAGATGTGSCTLANSSVQALLTIALRPNQAAVATTTKINAYAVSGAPDDKATVSKVNAYAVSGAPDDKATASKLTAYAVTGGADSFESVSKLVAYVVVEPPVTPTARPQVMVCT
jgi:hypothetical protein